jgi:DNA-binding NarL/FixJ family response regulator
MPKRVLIADDNKLVRRAIRTLLTKWPDVEVCAETDDGRKTVDTALGLRPDFVILDVRMPEMNGIEVASVLKKTLPTAKMILFTMYSDNIGRNLAAAAGVEVVLAKVEGLAALVSALDSFLGGTGVVTSTAPPLDSPAESAASSSLKSC